MRAGHAEIVAWDRVEAHLGAWRDLGARALEPNPFAEPAFVVSALRTFARADGLRLLFVWQDASRTRLIGAVVLSLPSIALGFGVARVWQSNQAGLAALMLDRDAGEEALTTIVAWIARERPGIIGLLAPSLEASGPTALAAEAVAQRIGAPCRIVAEHSRAILFAAGQPAPGFEAALPKKRLKEWSRQMRRLNERGAAAFRIAADDAAVEAFLALEAKGWKGAQRTALGQNADLAAFARSMLAAFAAEGRLAIHLLELDGAAIAAGLVLRSGARAFYWKTAYDESLAEYSPGVQLTLALSRALNRDGAVAQTDSCAIEGHPMIDRLWPARLKLEDRLLPTRAGASGRLAIWEGAERARRDLKEFAKGVINPLRGRKRS